MKTAYPVIAIIILLTCIARRVEGGGPLTPPGPPGPTMKSLDEISSSIDSISTQIVNVSNQVEAVGGQVGSMSSQVASFGTQLGNLATQLNTVQSQVQNLTNTISPIKSIQRGRATPGNGLSGSINITINAVNMSKALTLVTGSASGGGAAGVVSVSGLLINSTTINVTYILSGQNPLVVDWQVIEFK